MSLQSFVGKNTEKISKRVMKRIQDRGQEALDYWYDYLVEEMNKPKHGRAYTKTIQGKEYTWIASAPGEYPWNLTGRTIASIHKFVSVGPKQVRLYMRVGDGLEYVPWLESVRPLLRASQREVKDELIRILLGS